MRRGVLGMDGGNYPPKRTGESRSPQRYPDHGHDRTTIRSGLLGERGVRIRTLSREQRLELVRRAVDDQISYQQQVMKGVVQENKLAGNDVNSVLAYSRILRHQDVLVSLEEQRTA